MNNKTILKRLRTLSIFAAIAFVLSVFQMVNVLYLISRSGALESELSIQTEQVRELRDQAGVDILTIDALRSEVTSATDAVDDLTRKNQRLREQRDEARDEIERISAAKAARAAQVAAAARRAPQPVQVVKGGQSDLIRSVAAERGLSASDASGLIEIARRESTIGTNPAAYDPNRECVGLFQLDSNKGTYEQRADDEWNTNKAIDYIEGRYGSVDAAIAHSNAKGWY